MVPHFAGGAAIPLLVDELPTPDQVRLRLLGNMPGGRWPGCTYHIDGIGGKFSSLSVLRRCGCGIARIAAEGLSLDFGACFVLEGDRQTVPRSELSCFIVVGS